MQRCTFLLTLSPLPSPQPLPADTKKHDPPKRVALMGQATLRCLGLSLAGPCSELAFQLRQYLEQIADQAVIRDLEDRGVLVLVDGDDGLGILHACKVLDRA